MDTPARRRSPHGADVPALTRPPTLAPPASAARIAADDDAVEAPGVAVDFAGLVLLHPFLPRFFERTHVVGTANDAELAPDALARAAALLSYAARGIDDPFEFELGFVKVLLGLRHDSEVAIIAGALTPEDCVEVDELLTSVVEHWRVLKHTSVAGLRSAFLQRPGLLAEAEDRTWRLRVEPNAFDVLLDHLPWSIGTVKLPWMTKPLFTEWTTP